ncbi:hypothetical protein [Leeia oryzae]|uniref:hypothetical protein n=1 Tax=Leeia oryzae TaxID=356662 RepID=UPI00036896E6|nr:hypothetical protein [Leeia oryzae]
MKPLAAGILASLLSLTAWGGNLLSVQIGHLHGPNLDAGPIELLWQGNAKPASLQIGRLDVAGQHWTQVKLGCPSFVLQDQQIACKNAQLSGKSLPALFQTAKINWAYLPATSAFRLELLLPKQGSAVMNARQEKGLWSANAKLTAWPLASVADLIPASLLRPTKGTVDAQLNWQAGAQKLAGDMTLHDVSFSDESGNHAGENVSLSMKLVARQQAGQWQTNVQSQWQLGEIFWAPFYVKAPAQPVNLTASGQLASLKDLMVRQFSLDWPALGQLTGNLAIKAGQIDALQVKSSPLNLASLYATWLKPLAGEGLLSDLEVQGGATLQMAMDASGMTSLDLDLQKLYAEDRQGRLAIYGLTGKVPWRKAEWTHPALSLEGGKFFKLPFDATALAMDVKGGQLQMPALTLPLMGGQLNLKDLKLSRQENGWSGGVSGEISHVSMPKVSTALGWPVIDGELSASLPRVLFDPMELRAYGPIELDLFDGVSFLRNLKLTEPFGRAPRLTADLEMQNLDMGKLTKTFSFGAMEGKLDVTVDALTLVNWEVSSFDAHIENSPGDYRKRISQKAVENIGELGGAGFSGALQRSFLRFFESFGYSRLGLHCKLANNVCQMNGVAPAPNGYYLVVGGGVPSINVIGYNQAVHWSELVARIKRITQGGAPVVQ